MFTQRPTSRSGGKEPAEFIKQGRTLSRVVCTSNFSLLGRLLRITPTAWSKQALSGRNGPQETQPGPGSHAAGLGLGQVCLRLVTDAG